MKSLHLFCVHKSIRFLYPKNAIECTINDRDSPTNLNIKILYTKLMKKLFTFYVCFVFMFALASKAQVRVGDPGITFDLSNVNSEYLDDVQHWITAGVEGGIPFIAEQYDTILNATNSENLNTAIQKMNEKGGYRQIKLNNGTYTIDSDITMRDSVRLVGQSREGVIMNITMSSGIAFRFGCRGAGLDNMTIQGGYGVPNNFHMGNDNPDFMTSSVYFSGSSRNCWLDKLTIINSGNHAITSWRCSHITVRDCYIERSWNKGSGGRGYIQFSGDHCLMYNCVVKKMRHICIQREGCHHNVFYKNIVEQDFNFHSGDAGHNLVEQNVSVLPEGLGSGWHSVMGPWSYIHRVPGPGNVFYRNGCVENNNGGIMSYSSDTIVYSPVDFENRTPVVASDTLDQITSFYPAQESGIEHEIAFFNPLNLSTYSAGTEIIFLAKSLGEYQHVKLMNGETEIAQDNHFPYYFKVNNLPSGANTLTLVGVKPDGTSITSDPVTININTPTLSIQGVVEGQEIVPGNSVNIQGVTNGIFKKVSLYINGAWKASDHSAPYSFNYSFTDTGTFNVSIAGQLNSGQWVTVSGVNVNCVPLIITQPEEGDVFSTNESINVQALHFGDYEKVSLYLDGSWKRTDHSAPYSYPLSGVSQGEHSVYVLGKRTTGGWPRSSSVNISVYDKDIILVAPKNNQTYPSGATIQIDSRHFGDFERVSLYLNGSWNRTDHSAPYSFSKSGLADGTYQIKLLGKRGGQWIWSNEVTITIGEGTSSMANAKSAKTDVNELNNEDGVVVFPNPFTNQINIVNTQGFNTATLVDITGKTIDTRQLSEENLTWQVNHLNKGVYFILLRGENRVKTVKVIRR
ncbi:T9SS type A sorting domain-containing protein [Prolixibacteraceae bacterium JC049]|nr:T9SS type A sorting domain-containing protein [Prolixibacteraceae bacterium JC049]